MNATMTSNEKISEALRLLDAAAREKKDELRSLMTDKYNSLKDVVVETERNLVGRIAQAADTGAIRAKKAAAEVDERVHEHPWPYIGGVALGALLIGYILGRNQK